MIRASLTVAIGIAFPSIASSQGAPAGPQQSFRTAVAQNSIAQRSAPTVVRAVKVVISGKVQGVNYRNWAVRRAKVLRVRGWVENAADGTVRALFGGTEAAVAEMLAVSRQGPKGASVRNVAVISADVADVPADFSGATNIKGKRCPRAERCNIDG